MAVDVMHVNRLPFLTSLSKKIHYGTVSALDDMKIPTMEACIDKIIRSYSIRGFHVAVIHVDIQFKAMKDRKKMNPLINVVSRGEHVPDIERFHRVLKERARCYHAMVREIDIASLPKTAIIHLIITVNFYVNAFVWQEGVSPVLPLVTIVEGLVVDFNKHFHVIFYEYMHTYEGTTNTMKDRTVGALALGPSGNLQGGIRCFSFCTGKVLHRFMKDVTLLKMPHDVLGRLKYITSKEKSVKGLIFGDRNNDDIADDDITGVSEEKEENDDKHHYNLRIDDDPAIDAESDNGEEIDELDEDEVD